MRQERLNALQPVRFGYDSWDVSEKALTRLQNNAEWMKANPDVTVHVEGHADERGTAEYNLALGNRRAQAVVDFYTNFGLNADRFTIVSYGEERPASQESNESAWALNRRAEFVITAGQDNINPGRTP